MARKDVVMIGDPLLRQKADPVDFAADPVLQYVEDLRDTLRHLQQEKGLGRAIAAPQIGYLKRIVYMEANGQTITMINPEILSRSPELFDVWDSCFSADVAFFGLTRRHQTIRVRYQDQQGRTIVADFADDLAELFQHEIDHLDGVLFIDHIIDQQIIVRSEWERRYRPQQKE